MVKIKRLITEKFGLDEPRIGGLDGLRAVAILMVFNVHFFGFYAGTNFSAPGGFFDQLIAVLRGGHIGVDLFFVSSGYLIYRSIQKTRPDLSFLKKRFYRLMPAHVFTFIAYIFLGPWDPSIPNVLWTNLLLVAPFIKGMQVFGVTWSLAWEWIFYLFIFVTMRYGLRKPLPAFVSLLVMTLASSWVVGRFFPSLQLYEVGRFSGFLIGIPLFWYLGRGSNSKSIGVANFFTALSILGILSLQVLWSRYVTEILALPLQGGFYLAAGLLFTVLICQTFVTGSLASKFCSLLALRFLGKISYSFYLMHILLNWVLLTRLPKITSISGLLGYYVLTLAASIVASALMYYYLERPYFTSKAAASTLGAAEQSSATAK